MQLKWCQYLSLSCEEWPGTQLVEAYKFCITTHFSALLCKIGSCECRVDQQDMKEGGFLYIHFIKPCSPSLCPPPPHSHTLPKHAFAQSEESQLPAPVAHH